MSEPMSNEIFKDAKWIPSILENKGPDWNAIIENAKNHSLKQFIQAEKLYFSQYDKLCFDAYREECKKDVKR